MSAIVDSIKTRLLTILHKNKHFSWYVNYPNLKKKRMEVLSAYYTKEDSRNHGDEKLVVCLCDDKLKMGGITDRLRGVISTYSACKEMKLPMRILFTVPFRLEDYLQPATFDWRIGEDEISYDPRHAEPLCLEVTDNSKYQQRKMRGEMRREILASDKDQLHIYTDSHACYCDKTYGSLFRELFRPSPSLQQHIDNIKEEVGRPYVAVSTRFQQLLGDFTDCDGDTLNKEERQALMRKVVQQLEEIHATLPQDHAILCFSDSKSFLQEVSSLSYVHTVPGEIVHTDYCDTPSSEAIEKVFLDMLLIADAEEIFLLQTGKMYRSGFPYAASLINDRPFHHITF